MTFFITNIKHLMKLKGVTQISLASDLNISNTAISSWFVGKSKPTVDTLLELKEILKVNLDDLFFYDFTKESDFKNPKKLDTVGEPLIDYEISKTKEVTFYIEKDCKLTGGKCAFDILPELKAENEKLRKEVESLKNKK